MSVLNSYLLLHDNVQVFHSSSILVNLLELARLVRSRALPKPHFDFERLYLSLGKRPNNSFTRHCTFYLWYFIPRATSTPFGNFVLPPYLLLLFISPNLLLFIFSNYTSSPSFPSQLSASSTNTSLSPLLPSSLPSSSLTTFSSPSCLSHLSTSSLITSSSSVSPYQTRSASSTIPSTPSFLYHLSSSSLTAPSSPSLPSRLFSTCSHSSTSYDLRS